MSEEAIHLTVELSRGTSTYDCETLRASVAADSVEDFEAATAEVRQRVEELATELRACQPASPPDRPIADDQTTLKSEDEP
jgi:hypothetical protein